MSTRGNRRPRQQRPRPVEPTDTPAADFKDAPVVPLTTVNPGVPPKMLGGIVTYRINSVGVDEYRPAIVVRDDSYAVCTLYVFTLPGDQIAAAAKIAQMRAIARPYGADVGCWQLIK